MVMNKINMWNRINTYFREGVIEPIVGDYIEKGENGIFRADLIGSMILTHIGPRSFDIKEMPAIEPGIVSDLIKIYTPSELAVIECAYENNIFGWSKSYLSQRDTEILDNWACNPDCPIMGPSKAHVRNRYKYFVDKMIEHQGDIYLTLTN